MIYLVTTQQKIYSTYPCITPEKSIELLLPLKEISLDSETKGFDPFTCGIVCLQLGNKDFQLVIDITVNLIIYKEVLESKCLIIANAQFDLRFLFYYKIYPTKVWDTQLAEMILTTGLGDEEDKKELTPYELDHLAIREVSLKALALKYCGIHLDKEVRGLIAREGLSDRVIEYSAADIILLEEIKTKQIDELETFITKYNSTWKVVELEMAVVIAFSRMLYNGFNIDANKYKIEVIKQVEIEEKKYLQKLDSHLKGISFIEVTNPASKKKKKMGITYMADMFTQEHTSNIKWGSPEQKLGVLKALKVPVESTGAPALSKHEATYPIIKDLLAYNKFKKLSESFGKSLLKKINPVTGRLHPSIWQILSTGRISMSNPNLAQIPSKGELGKVIRSCFIPRSKDYVIVGGDYSGFELRLIAEFSQDPLWVKTFKEGGDLHSVLCSETFDIPIEDVKKPFYANPDITYRDVQKTINFGLAYGMSKYKLASTVRITPKEAQAIIDKFFSKVPKVKKFLDNLGELSKKRGYIKTAPPYSRVRVFPKWQALQEDPTITEKFKWLGQIERAGKNTPEQGSNGDIIKAALVKTQKYIDTHNLDVYLLLTVYDEIQSEAHISIAEFWRDKMQELMIEAAAEVIKTIPVVVDVKIDKHWCK